MKRSLRPSLALGLLVLAGGASAQRPDSPDAAYAALKTGTIWIQPGLKNFKINKGRVESAAQTVKPLELKILVIRSLGGEWVRNGRERRGGFAKHVNDQQLKLGDKGITIVVTQKGISGYNPKLSLNRLDVLNGQASRAVGRNMDFTSGVITLAQNISSEARTKTTTGTGRSNPGRTGTTAPVAASTTQVNQADAGSGLVTGLVCLGIPAAIGLGALALSRRAKKKRIEAARQEAIRGKDAATDAIAYVDSYDGLLSGPAADAVRQYRLRMGDAYDKGLAALDGAKNELGYGEAKRHFTSALTDFQASQKQIQLATGGTGVAYRLPPVVDDAQLNRAPLLEPVKGVSFFSSEPSNDLVPVEVNINGQLRTVMVTPAERAEFEQGRIPPIVGRQNGNQYQPWYDIDDYDPRRDYGRRGDLGYGSPWGMGGYGGYGWGRYGGGWGDGFSGILTGMAIGSIFSGGGLFGGHHHYGYGGYGGYGHGGDTIINNNYGDAGGGALGDGLSANDFGSGGDFGGGGFDFGSGGDSGGGGFDFGGGSGGDFGGGDFGGGGFDFGGGSDFGGGGDFGGGDFGGGGDW